MVKAIDSSKTIEIDKTKLSKVLQSTTTYIVYFESNEKWVNFMQ